MPTYDYRCEHCGHEFSRIQRFTDGALESCPNCGQRPTRLFSAPAIVFKGSGWYKTDSRKTPSDHAAETKTSDGSAKTDAAAKKDAAAGGTSKSPPAKDGGGGAGGGSSA